MQIHFQIPLIIILVAIMTGCASNPGVVKLSPDTYMISKQDFAGMFGNPAAFKAEVIREANEFAENQGKVAIPISIQEVPSAKGQFAQIEYQFRVVEKNDPEAKRTSLVKNPDITINKTETSKINIVTENKKEKQKDLYTELIKLDDLRKKGIITDAEFEIQKKKLINDK